MTEGDAEDGAEVDPVDGEEEDIEEDAEDGAEVDPVDGVE